MRMTMWLKALCVSVLLTSLVWIRFGHAGINPQARPLTKSDCPMLANVLKQAAPQDIKGAIESMMLRLGCKGGVAPVQPTPNGEWL